MNGAPGQNRASCEAHGLGDAQPLGAPGERPPIGGAVLGLEAAGGAQLFHRRFQPERNGKRCEGSTRPPRAPRSAPNVAAGAFAEGGSVSGDPHRTRSRVK
jgi:hypothetical protein